jgi:hypothetical protein
MKKHNVKDKKSFPNKSKGDLSKNILDIQDKPDVSVWNKEVRIQGRGKDKGTAKIGSLNQNLIREDTKYDLIIYEASMYMFAETPATISSSISLITAVLIASSTNC